MRAATACSARRLQRQPAATERLGSAMERSARSARLTMLLSQPSGGSSSSGRRGASLLSIVRLADSSLAHARSQAITGPGDLIFVPAEAPHQVTTELAPEADDAEGASGDGGMAIAVSMNFVSGSNLDAAQRAVREVWHARRGYTTWSLPLYRGSRRRPSLCCSMSPPGARVSREISCAPPQGRAARQGE